MLGNIEFTVIDLGFDLAWIYTLEDIRNWMGECW